MPNLKVGLDHGTCYLKLATSNGGEATIPNMLGEKPSIEWGSRELTPPPFIDAIEAVVNKEDPCYVGKAALTQCRAHHSVVEEGMIANRRNAVTTGLSLLTHLLAGEGSCKDYMGESNSVPSEFEVDAAVGVPVRTSAQAMEQLEEDMRGRHYVSLRHIATEKRVEAVVTVANARVLPKPYGAIFALEKDTRYSQYSDSTYCAFIVDVGQGSTDILAVEAGRILHPASTTTNLAIDTFLNDLANLVTEKFHVNVDAEDLGPAAQHDSVSISGRELDLKPYKERLVRDVAQQVFAVASRCLRNLPVGSNATHRILLTGGGSYLLGSHLKRMFEAKGYGSIFQPPDPLMINARGFVQYGELAWPD